MHYVVLPLDSAAILHHTVTEDVRLDSASARL
jgi:hypothetical protein